MTKLAAVISVGVAIVASNPLAAQPAARSASEVSPCAAVGETSLGGCEGFWNVYASIPQGHTWWFENGLGENPTLTAIQDRISKQAEVVQANLRRCGVTSYVSLSDWFDTFKGDLVVVVSKAHPNGQDAETELAKARGCGITGYTKFSPYQVAGRD
jgi:hypothetical protein